MKRLLGILFLLIVSRTLYAQELTLQGTVLCAEHNDMRRTRVAEYVIVVPEEYPLRGVISGSDGLFSIQLPYFSAVNKSITLLFFASNGSIVGMEKRILFGNDLIKISGVSTYKYPSSIVLGACERVEQNLDSARRRLLLIEQDLYGESGTTNSSDWEKAPGAIHPLSLLVSLLFGGALAGPGGNLIFDSVSIHQRPIINLQPSQFEAFQFPSYYRSVSRNPGLLTLPGKTYGDAALWNSSSLGELPVGELSFRANPTIPIDEYSWIPKLSLLLPVSDNCGGGITLIGAIRGEERQAILVSGDTIKYFTHPVDMQTNLAFGYRIDKQFSIGVGFKYFHQVEINPYLVNETFHLQVYENTFQNRFDTSISIIHDFLYTHNNSFDMDLSSTYWVDDVLMLSANFQNVLGSKLMTSDLSLKRHRGLNIGVAYREYTLDLGANLAFQEHMSPSIAFGVNYYAGPWTLSASYQTQFNSLCLGLGFEGTNYTFTKNQITGDLHFLGVTFRI